MKKQLFRITDMHCTACALSIDLDLEETKGVVFAKTNYAKSVTEVEYDPDLINTRKIVEIISKSGYTAVVI